MKRRLRVFLVAALAAAMACALVIGRAVVSRRPNVLLITLDTTRADRLGCYGYPAAETPALDRLAGEGLRFTRAYTHVPLTLPSHASILTGLRPPEHGLRDNARNSLAAATLTLPEIFRDHGYRTGAFVASFVLDRQFGLARGFETYEDRMEPPKTGDNVLSRENPGDVVCDRALAWLSTHADKPFFCWVHFFDPHDPYEPPKSFRNRIRDPYDGEIAFMDSQIGRLLDLLDRRALGRRTLVIVCGDHGEAFGEHGEFGHGVLLYEESMHVPMILRMPGRIAKGETDRLASLTDLAPTVLDEMRWTRPARLQGRNLLKGSGADGACYGESLYGMYTYDWAALYSLTTARWKYIQAPEPELYDLDNDPGEKRNLLRENAGVAGSMKGDLEALQSRMKVGQADTVTLNKDAVAKLRALGYLAGSGGSATNTLHPGGRPDPKSFVASVHNARGRAKSLGEGGQQREAVQLLEGAITNSPQSFELHQLAAGYYLDLGETGRARPHVEAALALEPDNRTMWADLGGILLDEGKPEEAARQFRKVLSLPKDPKEPLTAAGISKITIKAMVNMGVALTRANRLDEAAGQYLAVLRDDPAHLEANNNLANVYVLQGKSELAVEQFRRALAIKPDLLSARENAARLLCDQRKYAGAMDLWRQGLKVSPGDPVLLFHLAWWTATCPDDKVRNGAEAVKLGEALCEATAWSNAQALDTLAAAYAEAGDFRKAVETADKGLAKAKGVPEGAELAKQIEGRLKLYRASRPYRQ